MLLYRMPASCGKKATKLGSRVFCKTANSLVRLNIKMIQLIKGIRCMNKQLLKTVLCDSKKEKNKIYKLCCNSIYVLGIITKIVEAQKGGNTE